MVTLKVSKRHRSDIALFVMSLIKRNNYKLLIIMLFSYTLLLGYWMLFGFEREVSPVYMYNLVPFNTINKFLVVENFNYKVWIINLLGNIGVFIPFGILLPMVFGNKSIKLLIIFESGLITLETLQLLTRRGSFDVDDIILNTIGALTGYLIYQLISKLRGEK